MKVPHQSLFCSLTRTGRHSGRDGRHLAFFSSRTQFALFAGGNFLCLVRRSRAGTVIRSYLVSSGAEGLVREKERFANQIAELSPVVISVFDLTTRRDVYISPDVVNLVNELAMGSGEF